MAKKSNKTAHVLNLISSAKSASEAKEAPAQDDIVSQGEPSSIQNSLSQSTKNEELSEKIHDNLLAELGNHLSTTPEETIQESASMQNPMIDTEPAASSFSSQTEIQNTDIPDQTTEEISSVSDEKSQIDDTASTNQTDILSSIENTNDTQQIDLPSKEKTTEPEQVDTSTSNSENTISDAASSANTDVAISDNVPESKEGNVSDASDASGSSETAEDPLATPPHFVFVNICEELVKEKTVEYLQRFGVCTCSRCVADTMALALTNIQPKYVVMDPDTAVPFLSYYANKLSVNVMTELTKACLTVLAHPRHDPEEAKLELEQQAKQQDAKG